MRRYMAGPYNKKVLWFDGRNDYVEVPDSASLRLPYEFTIEALVKVVDYADWRLIVTKWNGGNYWFGIWNTGELRCYVKSGGVAYNVVGSVIPRETFRHAAVTFKDGVLRLYIDGELDAETTGIPTPLDTGPDPLHVGHNNDIAVGSQHFYGIIALVRVYNRALSEDEIRRLKNDAFSLRPASIRDGLVLEFIPDTLDCTNGVWRDNSGNNNNGTIYGAKCIAV